MRTLVGTTVIGCALCVGATTMSPAPSSAGVTDAVIDGLLREGIVRAAEADDCPVEPTAPDQCPDWLSSSGSGATRNTILVVTPGTDDGTLYPRIKGMRAGRTTIVINYPESVGPVIKGRSGASSALFAPTYDTSRTIAITNNRAVMTAFSTLPAPTHVVYTGYSQGADALGDAAEQAVVAGAINPATSHVILISDPRSPWGLKAWAARSPIVSTVMGAVGAESNGARDPRATGSDLPVTSVIVVGDPVANFQWVWYRPISSLLVDIAGFATIHSGAGVETYGNLINYELAPTVLTSDGGNTTYLVYQPKHHPLTLLTMLTYDKAGQAYTDADVARWDSMSNAFYPLHKPGASNAAVGVNAVPTMARGPVDPAPSAPPIAGRHAAIAPATPDRSTAAPTPTSTPVSRRPSSVSRTPASSPPAAGHLNPTAPTTDNPPLTMATAGPNSVPGPNSTAGPNSAAGPNSIPAPAQPDSTESPARPETTPAHDSGEITVPTTESVDTPASTEQSGGGRHSTSSPYRVPDGSHPGGRHRLPDVGDDAQPADQP